MSSLVFVEPHISTKSIQKPSTPCKLPMAHRVSITVVSVPTETSVRKGKVGYIGYWNDLFDTYQVQKYELFYLLGGIPTPPKNMSPSVGMIPNKTREKSSQCSKPPTSEAVLVVSINGGTSSSHPCLDGIFPNKNHPFWGISIYGNPLILGFS